ncbi:MAG: tRNA pseudouridine(55) synthase TruB [Bacilli bacterium]|nr:tRNA pseudouridine(55) synthase TruB [Bacilli bacterium]MDY6430185.1 tRNA pseudouridine(55) synthase TruB [Bacilli bacterium]
MSRESGILLIDKPSGMTSRMVDNKIGKIFSTRHVGHLGTLDPFATGLLIVGINKGNKALNYIDDSKKTYLASLVLGKKTDSGDKNGEVIEEAPIPTITDAEISAILSSFLGKSLQIPPMTSAKKVDGKALYKLAHKGIEIEREPKEIEIFDIRLIFRLGKQIDFVVTCSKGTYVRVLAEDIATKIGTVGHLENLRRLKIGEVSLVNSVQLEELIADNILNPIDFISLPEVELEEKDYQKVLNGAKMKLNREDPLIVFTYKGELVSVYSKENNNLYKCERGLF